MISFNISPEKSTVCDITKLEIRARNEYTLTHTGTHIYTHSGKTLVQVGRRSYRSQVRALLMEGLQ